jgi:hypothetical protein
MPFINGRYHVNPAMGQALEAAREAEAALLALQRQARKNSGDASASAPGDESADAEDPAAEGEPCDAGPIHHLEIEATELVPSNSGRATRGFVARVHRAPAAANDSPVAAQPPPPETHIFSDHGDLVNFLRDALAKDSAQR